MPAASLWDESELKKLVLDKSSQIFLTRQSLPLVLQPFHLVNSKSSVCDLLNAGVNTYQKTLNGILLSYKHPKLTSKLAAVAAETSGVVVDVEADFYVFRPEVNCQLKGVINKISKDHVGVLLYDRFNVSCPRPTKDSKSEKWLGNKAIMHQEVLLKLKDKNFTGKIPFFSGKLMQLGAVVDTNVGANEMEKTSKKKKDKKDSTADGSIIKQLDVLESLSSPSSKKRKKNLDELQDTAEVTSKKSKKEMKNDSMKISEGNPLFSKQPLEISPKKKKKISIGTTDEIDYIPRLSLDVSQLPEDLPPPNADSTHLNLKSNSNLSKAEKKKKKLNDLSLGAIREESSDAIKGISYVNSNVDFTAKSQTSQGDKKTKKEKKQVEIKNMSDVTGQKKKDIKEDLAAQILSNIVKNLDLKKSQDTPAIKEKKSKKSKDVDNIQDKDAVPKIDKKSKKKKDMDVSSHVGFTKDGKVLSTPPKSKKDHKDTFTSSISNFEMGKKDNSLAFAESLSGTGKDSMSASKSKKKHSKEKLDVAAPSADSLSGTLKDTLSASKSKKKLEKEKEDGAFASADSLFGSGKDSQSASKSKKKHEKEKKDSTSEDSLFGSGKRTQPDSKSKRKLKEEAKSQSSQKHSKVKDEKETQSVSGTDDLLTPGQRVVQSPVKPASSPQKRASLSATFKVPEISYFAPGDSVMDASCTKGGRPIPLMFAKTEGKALSIPESPLKLSPAKRSNFDRDFDSDSQTASKVSALSPVRRELNASPSKKLSATKKIKRDSESEPQLLGKLSGSSPVRKASARKRKTSESDSDSDKPSPLKVITTSMREISDSDDAEDKPVPSKSGMKVQEDSDDSDSAAAVRSKFLQSMGVMQSPLKTAKSKVKQDSSDSESEGSSAKEEAEGAVSSNKKKPTLSKSSNANSKKTIVAPNKVNPSQKSSDLQSKSKPSKSVKGKEVPAMVPPEDSDSDIDISAMVQKVLAESAGKEPFKGRPRKGTATRKSKSPLKTVTKTTVAKSSKLGNDVGAGSEPGSGPTDQKSIPHVSEIDSSTANKRKRVDSISKEGNSKKTTASPRKKSGESGNESPIKIKSAVESSKAETKTKKRKESESNSNVKPAKQKKNSKVNDTSKSEKKQSSKDKKKPNNDEMAILKMLMAKVS